MNMQWSNIKECHTERNMLHIQCKHTVCLFFFCENKGYVSRHLLYLLILSAFFILSLFIFPVPLRKLPNKNPVNKPTVSNTGQSKVYLYISDLYI